MFSIDMTAILYSIAGYIILVYLHDQFYHCLPTIHYQDPNERQGIGRILHSLLVTLLGKHLTSNMTSCPRRCNPRFLADFKRP